MKLKKFVCAVLFFLHCPLIAAYTVVIAGESACDDPAYLQEGRKPHRVMYTVLEAWCQIIAALEPYGITTTVIARDSLHLHPSADLYIFWDMPPFADFHIAQSVADKSFVVLCEPISVFGAQYNPHMLNQFKRVFTWDDQFATTFGYIKYTSPVLKSYKGCNVPFLQRKFSCMMCGNKRSWVDREMYSERCNIIAFFTREYPALFDLYGPGWNGIATYKGMVPDKRLCLENYRFNFCLENTKNTTGYITEKIFDAMEAGTIPIYKGASNIDLYIPRNCYIAYDDFTSLESLADFMQSITENEYQEYQNNIRAYLASPQAQQFAIPAYVNLFVSEIRKFFQV